MSHAHGKIAAFLPATADALQSLTAEQVETLDSYLYRFTKLQDTMGHRLFPQTLQLLAEDTGAMAFIDQLNRLEQLGALPSSQQWLDLRELRNTLAHEYTDDQEQLLEAIQLAFETFAPINQIYSQIAGYIATHNPRVVPD